MTDAKAKFEIRTFATLGAADHGWLDAHHHFSFGSYHDAARMSWGAIRVWNDDVIAPQSGFPPHPHADMEIITYVRTGAITHKDSLGNEGRTAAGDVQVMSAGSGIRDAEYNLENEPTTLFQIWIMPNQTGGAPVGAQSHSPRATVPARGKFSPAALTKIVTPCPSAPTLASLARPLKRVKA
jgi:redox-sensitive bicupin YhaK (pirin superfamily)